MRFIEQVKQSEELLFVRDDVLDTITSDEINEFKNIINPVCKYNILVVSKNINNDIISMKNVTNKIYNVDKYIDYIQEITNTPFEFTNLKANDKDYIFILIHLIGNISSIFLFPNDGPNQVFG